MSRFHFRFRWWLLSLFLLAFLLRAWDLGGKSLWLDEAFAVWNAARSPAEIWTETNDNHPPTYYLMLHYWMQAGQNESWLRLPSLFASMLSLALTFTLSRRLFGRETAFTAAALLAVAPLSVWYAQEARMVIFVAPFALLLALGLIRGDWKGGVMLSIGLAAGLYFDYTIVPLWVIISGLWLVSWWQSGRSKHPLLIWLAASGAGWLAFLPLWWHLETVVGRLGNIFVFANIRDQFGLPDLGAVMYVAALLALGIGSFIAGWAWQRLVKRPLTCQLLTITIITAFVLLTLLTPVPRLYSVKRVVVTGWPLVVLLVAMLLHWLRPSYHWLRVGIPAVSLAAVFVSLWLVPKDDWRGAVSYINQYSEAGDVVWLAPASGQNPYNYYQPKIPPAVGLGLMEEPPSAEIWHIAERQPGTPVPNGAVEQWLNENRPLLDVIPFYRLEVRRYGTSRNP